MSCCTVKTDSPKIAEKLKELKKHFDEVVIEKKEKYQLLTMRDKAGRADYDYVVWLSLKVSYGYENQKYHSSKSDDEMLEGVLKSVLDWIDALKNFEKKEKPKQLLFFDDEKGDDEFEKEPPTPASDENWGKYYRECERIRKRNAMKQYSFFELLSIEYYLYSGIDYREMLPSTEETREMYKQAILIGKDDPGRHHKWFWFDSPDYLSPIGGLSDIELINRLNFSIRLFLLPYKDYKTAYCDDSYNIHLREEKINYRYYLDGETLSMNSVHDVDKRKLPSFKDVFNEDFLLWIRETMNIPVIEAISDEEVLKRNIQLYIERMLWHKSEEYDFKNRINTFKDWKHFKADIFKFCKENGIDTNNGGGSGCSMDGYSASCNLWKKGEIKITQRKETRKKLSRSIDGLKVDEYSNDNFVVFHITGDEIFKKAFEFFNKKETANNLTLFDMIAV